MLTLSTEYWDIVTGSKRRARALVLVIREPNLVMHTSIDEVSSHKLLRIRIAYGQEPAESVTTIVPAHFPIVVSAKDQSYGPHQFDGI